MSEEAHHRQVAIAHNSTQLKRWVTTDRIGEFRNLLQSLGSSQKHVMMLTINYDDENFHETEDGMLWLEAVVSQIDHRMKFHQALSLDICLISNPWGFSVYYDAILQVF